MALETEKKAILLYSASDVAVWKTDELPQHPFLAKLGPDVLDLGLTPETVAARLQSKRFAGRAMAVVVSGLLQYGVANMITTIVRLRGSPVAAFRELPEAEAWLDEAIAKGD